MDETKQGPKHNLFRLLIQYHHLNFVVEAMRSILWTKKSIRNHASIHYISSLTFCETSLIIRFSRIVFENFEKRQISGLTVEYRDV